MSAIKLQGNAGGTGTLTVAAPSTNTNQTLTLPDQTGTFAVLTDGIGYSQTWQQPTRALGATYTNSTGKPIQINFSGTINNTVNRFVLSVNGVAASYSSIGTVANQVLLISGIIIPPSATYSINQTGGTPAIDFWSELR